MRNLLHGAAMALIFTLPMAAQAQMAPGQDGSGAATPVAATSAVPTPYYGSFGVQVGKGKLIKLPAPVASLFVADPGTATVHPASPDSMFVFGVKSGETDIVGTDQNGNRIAQFTVTVSPSSYAIMTGCKASRKARRPAIRPPWIPKQVAVGPAWQCRDRRAG